MLKRFALALSLTAAAGTDAAVPDWRPDHAAAKASLPAHLAGYAALPTGSVTLVSRVASKAGAPWTLHLPDGSRFEVELAGAIAHPNGDVSYSGTVRRAGALYGALLTVGRDASFGSWRTPAGEYRFESWGERGVLVDLRHPQLQLEAADHHAIGGTSPRRAGTAGSTATAAVDTAPDGATKATGTTVDVMFLFTPDFGARYPGTGAQTRINHLVAVANQSFADSAIPVVLRLVATEATSYAASESNETALRDMANALAGSASPFTGLRDRRSQTGADLMTLVRPHDIETRGSCGIAYLFGGGAGRGVNVLSDGFDSWSLCSDETYAHEVGHNLGAEHQDGANSPNAGFGTPFIAPGRLHTMMGSFGSGHPDRYLRVARFSNPDRFCGGLRCGLAGVHDNARRLRENMAAVSAYAAARSSLAASAPAARDPDVDGDGVPESADAFPHDARWHADRDGDGVADPVDAFPDDPTESADTDGDGIGDNADPDADGDGVENGLDAFPYDPAEQVDSDGDGVGDNADAFAQDRREWRDSDGDGIGDNAESDADGDGVPDFAIPASMADVDLLVISTGTDRVLRFDGATGLFAGVEIADDHLPQAFGRQSALAWNPHQKLLYALSGGGVRRYDRSGPAALGSFIAPNGLGPLPGLPSSFPAGLVVDGEGTVFVADEKGRSLARHDAITGAGQPVGLFFQPFFVDGPLRDAALAGERSLWTSDRYGLLVGLDAVTGTSIGSGVAPLLPADADVSDIVAAPDGASLLLADLRSNQVIAVSTATFQGAAMVAPGSGGLHGPSGLAFGPDGNLYVSSLGSDRVLRYDGSTGAFIDVFAKAPPGVLQQPRDLLFVPKVRDRYPRDAQRRFRPVPGGWYNPARSGHGIELQRVGDRVALIWYSYRSDGTPVWYLAPAAPLLGDSWSAPLLEFHRPGGGVEVGTVSLRFSDERHAEFSWSLPEGSGSEPMQLLVVGTGTETQAPTAAWYPPADSGWGLSLTRQGELAYAIAFLYDAAGAPTWVAGAVPAAGGRWVMPVSSFVGRDRCPSCAGTANAVPSPAGELVFELLDETRARVDAAIVGEGVDWQHGDADFRRLTDAPTRLGGDPLP